MVIHRTSSSLSNKGFNNRSHVSYNSWDSSVIFTAICTKAGRQVMDFSKVFDKGGHQGLLPKLECYKVRGRNFQWISNFLLHRNQQVVSDGHLSSPIEVESSVPQGSVLGPCLFSAITHPAWNLCWENSISLPSLQQRRGNFRLVMMYKLHNNLVHFNTETYISQMAGPSRTLHSQNYYIPHSETEHLREFFFPRTVRACDILPVTTVTAPPLETFRHQLMSYCVNSKHSGVVLELRPWTFVTSQSKSNQLSSPTLVIIVDSFKAHIPSCRMLMALFRLTQYWTCTITNTTYTCTYELIK